MANRASTSFTPDEVAFLVRLLDYLPEAADTQAKMVRALPAYPSVRRKFKAMQKSYDLARTGRQSSNWREQPVLSAAEAWCWVAHLLDTEESALLYKYPRSDEDMALANERYDQSRATYERAQRLDSDPDLWRRALEKWDGYGATETPRGAEPGS